MFLVEDLIGACEARFKRSKTDGATYRRVWDGLKLWVSFQYGNGRGCDLPHFGRIVLQPQQDGGQEKLTPYFILSSRAKDRHGLSQGRAAMVSTKRMHVAKLNHVAIATVCGVGRDQVGSTLKELLWCLLECMANRPEVLINIGVGDLHCAKGKVTLNFETEAGKGSKGLVPLCPLSSNSVTEIDRLSLASSASTLRPPSACGTELDWDSFATTLSKRPSVATIQEVTDERDDECTSEAVVPKLPQIAGAAAATEDSDSPDAFGIVRTEVEKREMAKDYLKNHKSTKDWTARFTPTNGHDAYLDRVFDRYEDALLRSESALKQETVMTEQATKAEEQLRNALENKKLEERLSVAKSLKSQIKLREKELERERLEAMILSEPSFPQTERSMMSTERQKQLALRSSLDEQVAMKSQNKKLDARYEQIQESRKQLQDANRYQDEIVEDMVRRRNAGRELCAVWERQKNLRAIAARVSNLY